MSQRVKLTKRSVDAVAPDPTREQFLWDSELRGFGLRVQPSGRRSYLVQYKVGRSTRRLTIGPHGVLTVDQARRKAIQALAAVRVGGDPSRDRRSGRATFAELAERYVREHAEAKKRASAIASDKSLLRRVLLPRLGATPTTKITRDDISRLHHGMRETPIRESRSRPPLEDPEPRGVLGPATGRLESVSPRAAIPRNQARALLVIGRDGGACGRTRGPRGRVEDHGDGCCRDPASAPHRRSPRRDLRASVGTCRVRARVLEAARLQDRREDDHAQRSRAAGPSAQCEAYDG